MRACLPAPSVDRMRRVRAEVPTATANGSAIIGTASDSNWGMRIPAARTATATRKFGLARESQGKLWGNERAGA